MPSDLNKMLADILKESSDTERDLNVLLNKYEELYRESSRQFNQERYASNSMAELDGFYRLVQTLKRNRDVIGSLVRGIKNLRPLSAFKFVVEDVPEPPVRPIPRSRREPEPNVTELQAVLQNAMEEPVEKSIEEKPNA
jgi:hypothetical protein